MPAATTPENPTPTPTGPTSYEELVPSSCGYENKIIEHLQESGYEPSELSSEIEGDGELYVESDDGDFGVNYDTECSTPTPTGPTSYEELVPSSCGYENKIIERLQESGYEPSELSSEIEGNGELRVESDDGDFGVDFDTEPRLCSTPADEPTPEPADLDRATPTDEPTRPPPTTANASVGETQSDSGRALDQLLLSGSGETTTALLASYVIGFAMVAVMVTFVAYIVYREYGPDELFTHSE